MAPPRKPNPGPGEFVRAKSGQEDPGMHIWCGSDGWQTIGSLIELVAQGVARYAEAEPLKWRVACRNHGSHFPYKKRLHA
jgi:hypothetical protein